MTTTEHQAPRELAEDAVRRYATAMSARDVDALTALFAADATREDPIGTPVATGADEIRKAFESVLPSDGTTVEFARGDLRGAGPAVAFPFTYTATPPRGPIARQRGIDVVTVNEDGLIQSLVAYWGAEDAD